MSESTFGGLFAAPNPFASVPSIVLRDYQERCLQAVAAARDRGVRRALIVLPTGCGKCLAKGTPVLMFDGVVKRIEDIRQGEWVMGPDSRPRTVLSTCRGEEMMYRVRPVKGDPYVVNESHILSLKLTPDVAGRSHELVNISVRGYLSESSTFRHRAKGWRAAVEWPERHLLIPPYILGLWLGDGHAGEPRITTPDEEVVQELEAYCAQAGLRLTPGAWSGKARTYRLSSAKTGRGHRNPLKEELDIYGILRLKRIPHAYKVNAAAARLELLAGLIDTDGWFNPNGGYEVGFEIQDLAEDVLFLARSLGFGAYMKKARKKNTVTGRSSDFYRITISGDLDRIPVRVERRKARPRRQIKDVLVTGISVEPVGFGEYFGFELSGDGLFLLGDFTVTHNTTVFSEHINERSDDPEFAAIVLAHRAELLDQGARRIATQNPHLVVSVESGSQRASEGADVVVAGVQTIGRAETRRLEWMRPTDIITDEAHHAPADSYMHVYRRFGVFEEGSGVFHLGVTATPHRLDNKPLHGTETSIFEEVVFSYTLREAIKDGYLVDLRGYRVGADLDLRGVKKTGGDYSQGQLEAVMNTDPHNELAFKSWSDVAAGRKTIVFCAGVEHAEDVAAVFSAHGVPAECVNGGMKPEVREAIMRRFRDGRTLVLTNVEIATEGFDVPDVGCVLMLRPTMSWSLYAQMIGRGLRVLPGVIDGVTESEARKAAIGRSEKPEAIVIDVVGNSGEHSLATLPGLVNLPPRMDLEGNLLGDAIDKWEELDEGRRATLFARPTTFAGLSGKLEEVDLLAELAVPEEVARVSSFAWLKVGDGSYFVDCGATDEHRRRHGRLKCDPLGFWVLNLSTDKGETSIEVGNGLEEAFQEADVALRREFPGAYAVAGAKARWRKDPPTEKQVFWLRKKGVAEDVIAMMDKGQANAMLTRLFNGGRKR